jgi:hypothetical protein
LLLRIRSHPRDAHCAFGALGIGLDHVLLLCAKHLFVAAMGGWLRALLPPRRWKSRWCVFPAGRSSCFPYGSGEEAGGEESSIPSDDLGTLATGGCYVAERGSEHLGLRQRPPLRCRVSYRDVTGTNTMAEIITIDRPSVAKPVSRPQSRKRATVSASARCTSIAAGPTSASSKPKA